MTRLAMKAPLAVALAVLLLVASCYPGKEATMYEGQVARDRVHPVKTPAKVFLEDGSYVVFADGFTVEENRFVRGVGQRYRIGGADHGPAMQHLPLDSVAAMTYYDIRNVAGSILASTILGLYGGFISAMSVYCISCPKCCFGSCPTVYTGDGEERILEAELFSYSLSKFHQEEDLDRLEKPVDRTGRYEIQVTNEALETHYIDQLTLIAAVHPPGTDVFPTHEGRIISTARRQAPSRAVTRYGEDVLELISHSDARAFRSDSRAVKNTARGRLKDWVDVDVNLPEEVDSLTIVFRLRNTLLSTILLYDVVLASQGIDALRWAERLNTDVAYAADYHRIYNAHAGMKIKTKRQGAWLEVAAIPDVGPIAWKHIAAVIPIDESQTGSQTIRLEFFPDNVMIDYIGVDVSTERDAVRLQEVRPSAVVDHDGRDRSDVIDVVSENDERFLITEPGEAYEFQYQAKAGERPVTPFVKSNGYYIEWIRGEWVAVRDRGYRFDLYRVRETLAQLRESWLANRDDIQERFFETRIPIRGGQ